MRPFKVRLEYADMQGASYKTLDECISRMEGNDRMEKEGDSRKCEACPISSGSQADTQVVNLLKERFPSLTEALLADIAMSPTVIGADQKSVVNITDGAAAT